ncbi:glycoside hydrolase family 45 protein [Flagelloscypha sp. PMI_526]|nr:glycoside hydrolase family 45 protein [Flagelloscypha sp. PMI_526]
MLNTAFLVFLIALAAYAQQMGRTTRYWDCCKPSCAWHGKAFVSSPVLTCDAGGTKLTDPNDHSGCDGGASFSCADTSPFAVSDLLAYGFAATSLAGGSESSWCCACYELTFLSTSLANSGKKMVIQATNTGADLGLNQFDLQIPGGGVGIFTQGCPAQFSDWNGGAQYGGVSSRLECDNLPEDVRRGCYFRFDWFEGADNPAISFKEVSCPSELTAISGCLRL